MNTNPQATTAPNISSQAPKQVTPTTVAPTTSTLSIKKDEPYQAPKPVTPAQPVDKPVSSSASTAPVATPTATSVVKKDEPAKRPAAKKSRTVSPEQKEALLVNRLMNLNDYLNVSDKDLEEGRQAVEKRLKALQQLERTIVKYQKDRAQKVQEQERAITAQKAMDLFLEGRGEDAKKLFQEYQAKYGSKK